MKENNQEPDPYEEEPRQPGKRTLLGRVSAEAAATGSLTTLQPWERVYYIHEAVESGACPDREALASALSVAVSTIDGDISYMRSELNLPIQFDPARNGYCYQPGDPVSLVSEQDSFALLVAARTMAQARGTRLEAQMRASFHRMIAELSPFETESLTGLRACLSRPFAPENLATLHTMFKAGTK
jgi:hypothetical protein